MTGLLTTPPPGPAVRVQHPQVAALLPAVALYADVLSGRWEAVAEVCADALIDPAVAGAELAGLRIRAGYDLAPVAPLPAAVDGDVLTMHGPAGEVAAVVDLYARVLTGQWREVDWVCRLAARSDGGFDGGFDGLALEVLRVHRQRAGAYPEVPGASWSIGNSRVPVGGRLAYNVWKLLGGGVPDRAQLPVGAAVRVDVRAAGA